MKGTDTGANHKCNTKGYTSTVADTGIDVHVIQKGKRGMTLITTDLHVIYKGIEGWH